MSLIKFNIDDYKKEIKESNGECIKVKLCTKRLSEDEKLTYKDNLNKLYDFCKLDRPKNIVFVSSPILLAFSSGAARYYWNELATHSATRSATRSATHSATYSATYSATDSATYSATRIATHSATYSATRIATHSATRIATHSATRSATHSATYSATYSATRSATRSATHSATYSATYSATDSATGSATDSATYSATRSATGSFEITTGVIVPENYLQEIFSLFGGININKTKLLEYIKSFNTIYQGGNNWADYDYYLNFYRRIGKPVPDYDYTGFDLWSSLNIAGARVLEKDFAMVSEKPTSIIMKDNLAHNLEGPAIEYMDGVKLYMAYNNLIPSWIVTTPKNEITKEMILNEENADYRRYLIERIGIEKYTEILGAKVLDAYTSNVGGKYELLEVNINGDKCKYLKMINQTEFVFHVEGVDNRCKNVKEALMFRNGMKVFGEPKYLS